MWGGIIGWLLGVVVLGFAEDWVIQWPFIDQQTTKGDRIRVAIGDQMMHVVFKAHTGYQYGDTVALNVTLKPCQPPTNPGQFDFCKWQHRVGIDSMAFVRSHSLVSPTQKPAVFVWVSSIPKRLFLRCQWVFEAHFGLIYTMIFGARQDFVSEDIQRAFSSVGLIHLLVVSGAQISCITGVTMWVAFKLFRWPFMMSFVGLLFVQLLYCFIAGVDPSILRSVIMTDVFIWHHFWSLRRYPLWWYVLVAAGGVILIMPRGVLMPGFWYSFLITLGLVYGVPSAMHRIQGPRFLIAYVSASIIATGIAIPIQLIQSSVIMPMAVVSNAWVSWLSSVVLFGGLATLIVSMISIPLGKKMGMGVDFIADVMVQLSTTFAQMGGVIAWDQVTIISVFFTVILSGVMIYFHAKQHRIFRYQMVVGLVVLMGVNLGAYVYLTQRQFVLALDVGQGDATLVVSGFDAILVDAAGLKRGRPIARDAIIPTLHYFGIDQLDALIITHHDTDHRGGLPDIVQLGVEHIFSNDVMAVANHHHVRHPMELKLRQGSVHLFPPSLLSPLDSINNRSLVVDIELSGCRFLITGDMDERMEMALVRHGVVSEVDVLKLGHHGSRYSTSHELLLVTNPNVAWNSSGRYNRYGHPHVEVLDRLAQRTIPLVSTHLNGAIMFKVRRHGLLVLTDPGFTRGFYINR